MRLLNEDDLYDLVKLTKLAKAKTTKGNAKATERAINIINDFVVDYISELLWEEFDGAHEENRRDFKQQLLEKLEKDYNNDLEELLTDDEHCEYIYHRMSMAQTFNRLRGGEGKPYSIEFDTLKGEFSGDVNDCDLFTEEEIEDSINYKDDK